MDDFMVEQLLQVVKKCQRLINFISKQSFQKHVQSGDANNAHTPNTTRTILGDLTKEHENKQLNALCNDNETGRKNGIILRLQKIGNSGNGTPSWKASKESMDTNPQTIEIFGDKSCESLKKKYIEPRKRKMMKADDNKKTENELKTAQMAPEKDECFLYRHVQPIPRLTFPYPEHQDLFMQENNVIKEIECDNRIDITKTNSTSSSMVLKNGKLCETTHTENSGSSENDFIEQDKRLLYENVETHSEFTFPGPERHSLFTKESYLVNKTGDLGDIVSVETNFTSRTLSLVDQPHDKNNVEFFRRHENVRNESDTLSERCEIYPDSSFDFEDNFSESRKPKVQKATENVGVGESYLGKDLGIQETHVQNESFPLSNVVSDTVIDDFEMFSDSSFNFDVNLDEIMVSDLESMCDDDSIVEALDLSTSEHKKKNIEDLELEPLNSLPITRPVQTDLSYLTSHKVDFPPKDDSEIKASISLLSTQFNQYFLTNFPPNDESNMGKSIFPPLRLSKTKTKLPVLPADSKDSKMEVTNFDPPTGSSTQFDQSALMNLIPNDESTMEISGFPLLTISLAPALSTHKYDLASDGDSKRKTSQVPPLTKLPIPNNNSHLAPYMKDCIPVKNSIVESLTFSPVTRSDTPVDIPSLAPHKENYEDPKMEPSIVFPLARSSTPITLSESQKETNHSSSGVPISLFSGERHSADEARNKMCQKFESDSVIVKFRSGRIEAKENIGKELNSQSAVIPSELIRTRCEMERNGSDTFLQREIEAEVAKRKNQPATEYRRSTETDKYESREDNFAVAVNGSVNTLDSLNESFSTKNCEVTVNPIAKNIATQHIRSKSSSAKSFLLWLIENKFVEPGHQVRLIGETFETFAKIKSSGLVQHDKRGFTLTQWISTVREARCTRLSEAVKIVDYKGVPLSFFFEKFKEGTEKRRLKIDISEIKVLLGERFEFFFSRGIDIIDLPL
ncbi:uncharacterized protein LOC136030001 isoform X2 [Artemia franciscana]|uniref:uncharacterized protein LOC136030001 isoform X2 n=1 Tax=Artemia franciscana TaxID=6661 RepID=UPI0032DAF959